MSGKPKPPGPPRAALPAEAADPSSHPPPTFPRSDTLAGQKAGVRTGAKRNQAQGKARTEAEAISSAFSPTRHRWGNVNEGWSCWGSWLPYPPDFRVFKFTERLSSLHNGGGKDHWLKRQVIQTEATALQRSRDWTEYSKNCVKFNMARK